MAGLANNERAYMTARAGCARADAVRTAFAPRDTRLCFYTWSRPVLPAGTWTTVKR